MTVDRREGQTNLSLFKAYLSEHLPFLTDPEHSLGQWIAGAKELQPLRHTYDVGRSPFGCTHLGAAFTINENGLAVIRVMERKRKGQENKPYYVAHLSLRPDTVNVNCNYVMQGPTIDEDLYSGVSIYTGTFDSGGGVNYPDKSSPDPTEIEVWGTPEEYFWITPQENLFEIRLNNGTTFTIPGVERNPQILRQLPSGIVLGGKR